MGDQAATMQRRVAHKVRSCDAFCIANLLTHPARSTGNPQEPTLWAIGSPRCSEGSRTRCAPATLSALPTYSLMPHAARVTRRSPLCGLSGRHDAAQKSAAPATPALRVCGAPRARPRVRRGAPGKPPPRSRAAATAPGFPHRPGKRRCPGVRAFSPDTGASHSAQLGSHAPRLTSHASCPRLALRASPATIERFPRRPG